MAQQEQSYKPLVIDSKVVPNGEQTRWSHFDLEELSKNIIIPSLKEGIDTSPLVSGMPTVFARANLFTLALGYRRDKDQEADGIMLTYESLVREWRGFIACIALDYSHLTVERIRLAYSDGKDATATRNLYEPKGAFGSVLFDRKLLWCQRDAKEEDLGVPFINIIKYDHSIVVGATSPDSLLFTAASYSIPTTSGRPYVNFQTGRFCDPLVYGNLDEEQTRALYAYVEHLIANIHKLENYYQSYVKQRTALPNYGMLEANLTNWSKELKDYADKKHFKLESASIPPVSKFGAPFDVVFNYRHDLYGSNGAIYRQPRPGFIQFDPKELLLPGDAEIARLRIKGLSQNEGLRSRLPVIVMRADIKGDPGSYAYFSLPLSTLGLRVYGNNVGSLVGQQLDSSQSSTLSVLSAVYDPNAEHNNLEVKLKVRVTDTGQESEMAETYTSRSEEIIRNRDLIMWPNFISRQWDRYFLYSELPHYVFSKDHPFRAVPFAGDYMDVKLARQDGDEDKGQESQTSSGQSFDIITDKNGEPVYLGDADHANTAYSGDEVKAQLHIVSNDLTADKPYKYEIYESNKPFKGLRLTSATGHEAGFLLINYSTGNHPGLPKDRLSNNDHLRTAKLGVDFGSTNTSIAFCLENQDAMPISFKNRRIMLLRVEEEDENGVAGENKLFFFQSNPIQSNAIKSVLTLHDTRCINRCENEAQEVAVFQKEIKGGFPCFSSNLPVNTVTEDQIQLLCAQCGDVRQIHNMKWADDIFDQAYKMAFLRSLMLHVYAELFEQNIVPTQLVWSYPSSMSEHLQNQYANIWTSVPEVLPLADKSSFRLKVSRPQQGLVRRKSPLDNQTSLGGGSLGGGSLGSGSLGSGSLGGGSLGGDSLGGGSLGGDSLGGGAFGGGSLGGRSLGGGAFGGEALGGGAFGGEALDGDITVPDNADTENDDLVAFTPDDDNAQIVFDPIQLLSNRTSEDDLISLTEAQAVANFLSKNVNGNNNANDRETLTLCFDIGGSTTDISALCNLRIQGQNMPQLTMIKQSSIRFAAQRVAEATRYSPNFKEVLLATCDHFHIRVQGLNLGESRYSPDTASYYFEQIVDRLGTDQLPYLYDLISTRCQELMCVNLYVSGLILYYAGQLSKKLIKQVRACRESFWTSQTRPKISVVFAGKGARIFEWWATTNFRVAKQYYQEMFVRGMGGEKEALNYISNYPTIDLSNSVSSNVKYEVSMGLAQHTSNLWKPRSIKSTEIIGESGYTIRDGNNKNVELSYDNSITTAMMKRMGGDFYGPSEAGLNFRDFCNLYYDATRIYFNTKMRPEEFYEGWDRMNLNQYVTNMPEYRRASKAQKFDFVYPIIILEGMRFYDSFLLQGVCKR